MTKLVRPNEEAEEEFRYYIRRYESESIALGDRLWAEIQTAIALISVYPSIGQPCLAFVGERKCGAFLLDISRFFSCTASIQIISK